MSYTFYRVCVYIYTCERRVGMKAPMRICIEDIYIFTPWPSTAAAAAATWFRASGSRVCIFV